MKAWKVILKTALAVISAALTIFVTVAVFEQLFFSSGSARFAVEEGAVDVAIMDRYDTNINNCVSDALSGVMSIEKVYWLSDDDFIAPEPDQSKYGTSNDPSSLGWLLEAAADLMDGQQIHFSTETVIAPGTEVLYYLDETIFAVTWKEVMDGGVYTFSEVKIQHPSQIRRFLAGGEFGSEIRLKTTDMAATVNAVVASSGDFYDYRRHGVIVYDGRVQRVNSALVDTCYIDENGDMLFSYTGELSDYKTAQQFVNDNNIRFSMAFGPVLVDHGRTVDVRGYFLGQIDDPYPRAALCQMGKLHYIVMVVNAEGAYQETVDLYTFAQRVWALEPEMAYTLDGGQTAVIAMNDQLINAVLKGSQRDVSDIFYFATAIRTDGGS